MSRAILGRSIRNRQYPHQRLCRSPRPPLHFRGRKCAHDRYQSVLPFLYRLRSIHSFRLGAGTVGDIAAPHERGTYIGIVLSGSMIGPCIG